jgi:hypothetical protein
MRTPTTVLAFDPSTTITGWALMRTARDNISFDLLEFGRWDCSTIPPLDRAPVIYDQAQAAMNSALEHAGPNARRLIVAMEWPSAYTHGGGKEGKGRGLAMYGTAPGIVYGAVRPIVGEERIKRFNPNQWSRGITKRGKVYRLVYPGYTDARDPGDNIADAIGIAEYTIALIDQGYIIPQGEAS